MPTAAVGLRRQGAIALAEACAQIDFFAFPDNHQALGVGFKCRAARAKVPRAARRQLKALWLREQGRLHIEARAIQRGFDHQFPEGGDGAATTQPDACRAFESAMALRCGASSSTTARIRRLAEAWPLWR